MAHPARASASAARVAVLIRGNLTPPSGSKEPTSGGRRSTPHPWRTLWKPIGQTRWRVSNYRTVFWSERHSERHRVCRVLWWSDEEKLLRTVPSRRGMRRDDASGAPERAAAADRCGKG